MDNVKRMNYMYFRTNVLDVGFGNRFRKKKGLTSPSLSPKLAIDQVGGIWPCPDLGPGTLIFCVQIFKKSEEFRFFKNLNAKDHGPGTHLQK